MPGIRIVDPESFVGNVTVKSVTSFIRLFDGASIPVNGGERYTGTGKGRWNPTGAVYLVLAGADNDLCAAVADQVTPEPITPPTTTPPPSTATSVTCDAVWN